MIRGVPRSRVLRGGAFPGSSVRGHGLKERGLADLLPLADTLIKRSA